MKTETKILIVLIILILSVGPLTFFLEGKKEIELPEREEQPLFHEFNANITGKIMSFEPYISYVGVSLINNKSHADKVIQSIGIKNYSLEMSLNPNGPGYQYSVLIPLNETQNAKEIGFRLAFRFLGFFAPGKLPLIVGEAEPPTFFPVNQTTTITVKENFTVKTIFLYSKQKDEYAQINCNMITSLNYSLVKASNCYDTNIFEAQEFLGLSAQDFYILPMKQKTMNLSIEKISQTVFEGNFDYEVNVSKEAIQNQTNATIEIQEPEQILTLYGTNASLLKLTDDFSSKAIIPLFTLKIFPARFKK